MNITKETNRTVIELNDVERTFLLIILEAWERPGSIGANLHPALSQLAAEMAEELAP